MNGKESTVKDSSRRRGASREDKVNFYRRWCKKCGLCAAFCPRGALTLNKEGFPIILLDGIHSESSTVDHARLSEAPLSQVAQETVGNELAANIVALGAIVGLGRGVSRKAMRAALAARAPRGSLEANKKALQAGFKVGRRLRGRKE